MIAFNIRVKPSGKLAGYFDLRLPHAHVTYVGCKWFNDGNGNEWVKLPQRSWVGSNGQVKYENIIIYDDVWDQRFEDGALLALEAEMERIETDAKPEDARPVSLSVVVGGVSGDDVPF
jgi:hypothetical protein